MYYPCSENKDADQLRGYREADLRLCFRPCKLLVFSRTGSNVINESSILNIDILSLHFTSVVNSPRPLGPMRNRWAACASRQSF